MKTGIKIFLLILVLSACQSSNKINNFDYFALGAFYANNQKDSKDSANHFQQNCHFLMLLQNNKLEVYNRNSDHPDKKERYTLLKLNKNECLRFKNIVSKLVIIKEPKNDNNSIYDGLSFIASKNSCQSTGYQILNFGIAQKDQSYIFELFEKAKIKSSTRPSNRIIKEKYFMLGLLHQTNYIEEENAVEFKDL